MKPRPITEADMAYWFDVDPESVVYAADDETFQPCPAIKTRDREGSPIGSGLVVRVPYALNEIELTHLAKGGTLWLSTWGGLPPHFLEVQAP